MSTLMLGKYELQRTCIACPEQYDVIRDGIKVGYLRLRHGRFYAAYPDVSGEIVYEASPQGDGMFRSIEREMYLAEAVAAIDKRWLQDHAKPEAGHEDQA